MTNPFKLQNGSIFVITEAPGGLYNSEQLKLIADLCEREAIVTKVTEDQRLGLIIEETKYQDIATELQTMGLGLRHYQSGIHQPVGCLGAHCPLHEQDALSTTMQMTEAFASRTSKSPVRIGINGCSAACVPTHTLDVSILGETAGYRVSLGGKNSQLPEMAMFLAEGVPSDQIVDLVGKALDAYEQQAEPGESLQDVIQRVGTSSFVEAFAPFSQDAAPESDPMGALKGPDTSDMKLDEQLDAIPTSEQGMDASSGLDVGMIDDDLLDEPSTGDAGIETMDEVDFNLDEVQFETEPESSAEAPEVESIPTEEFNVEEMALIEEASDDTAGKSSADEENEVLAIEAKLEESIAEQEAISEIKNDENLDERTRALELVEGSVTQLRPSDNLESFDADANLSEDDHFDQNTATEEHAQPQRSHGMTGFEMIQSVNINDEFTTLTFAAGSSLTIDMQKLRDNGGRRSFTINGQEISLRLAKGQLFVCVDGLEISFSEAA